MNNQTGSIQTSNQGDRTDSTQRNEVEQVLGRQIELLEDIREQLEPTHLRSHTEDSLNSLVLQLQEVTRVIRFASTEVVESLVPSKKTLLTDIQNATIKLIMALDQLTTRGQTSYFYKHLVTCQEYLDAAVACRMKNPFALRENHRTGTPKAPPGSLFMHARKYAEDLDAALTFMSNLSIESDIVRGDQLDQVAIVLNATSTCVWELNELLMRDAPILDKSFSYSLRVNLSYLKDQIPRLLDMVKTFGTSPKQARKISNEIAFKLKAISRSCSDVSHALSDLPKQAHPHVRKENNLRLIYSSAQIAAEKEEVV